MFDLSDEALAEIETRAKGASQRSGGGFAMPSVAGFGDDQGAPAPDPSPLPAPMPPPGPLLPQSDDAALRRGAGRALLFVSGGLAVGWLVGGTFGAAAGVVGAGAIRNALRVREAWNSPSPDERSEAGKSATMAIFGFGIAGMLAYKAYQKRIDS